LEIKIIRFAVPGQAIMLDTKVLNSLRALGEDFLCDIIIIYLRDLHSYVERIEKAVNEEDAENGEINSHSLKGASYSLGAKAVGDICYSFERAFEDASFEGMEGMLVQLKEEVNVAESELKHLQHKLERSMEAFSER
jgi:HPt (histidine-containing phosphotransfer) domain-containing protein